jgi:hypothetical protein
MSTLLIDVEKVRQARCEMENEILGSVVSAVRKFKDVTGVTPESIHVQMLYVATLQSMIREYVPCAVNATVNLEL